MALSVAGHAEETAGKLDEQLSMMATDMPPEGEDTKALAGYMPPYFNELRNYLLRIEAACTRLDKLATRLEV